MMTCHLVRTVMDHYNNNLQTEKPHTPVKSIELINFIKGWVGLGGGGMLAAL